MADHDTHDHTGVPGVGGSVATDAIWDAAGDLVQGTGANTAAKLSAGSAGKVLTSNGAAAALTWETPGGGGSLVLLSSNALGSAAADITVTGISASYKDLIVVVSARSSTASAKALQMQVGSGSIDTGSNYWYFRIYYGSLASGTSSSASASLAEVGNIPGSGSTAGWFGSTTIEIIDYASTSRSREMITHSTSRGDDGTFCAYGNVGWQNVSGALNQIKIYPSAGNLDTGSRVYIYGRG